LAETYLREQISRILQMPPAGLDAHQSLNNLGIDSLMAVELRNHVQAHLGVIIPLAKLLQDPTIAQLAEVVLDQVTGEPTSGQSEPAAAPSQDQSRSADAPAPQPSAADDVSVEATIARLSELSDEEVEAMLRHVLSKEKQQA
jgi:acyl carrier protein